MLTFRTFFSITPGIFSFPSLIQLSTVAASPKNTWLNYYAKFLNIYVTIHYILYVFLKLFPWSRFLYDPVLILIVNLFWVYKYTCQCFKTFLRISPCWKLIELRCFSNVSAKLFMILNPLKCTSVLLYHFEWQLNEGVIILTTHSRIRIDVWQYFE